MIRHATFAVLCATLALGLAGCGKNPRMTQPDLQSAIKSAPKVVMSAPDRDREFPASVATLNSEALDQQLLVVRFRAAKLGFNNASKVGFPVVVRGKEEFKSNLYLGTDNQLYISDLGQNAKPRFWKVGAYGVPSTLKGRPKDGDALNFRLDPGIELKLALMEPAEGETTYGIFASMAVRATPPATMSPALWSAPLSTEK